MTTKDLTIAIIAAQVQNIAMTDDLRSTLKLDSLDAVELLIKFEKEFNIHIDDDLIYQVKTVRDVVELIEDKVANRKPTPRQLDLFNN